MRGDSERGADRGYVTYEDFGRRFFDYAVSEDRVAGAFRQLAGTAFDFGPISAGPGRIARVAAHVKLGDPILHRRNDDIISFQLRIPLRLRLTIDLLVDKTRYDVEGDIHLRLAARAAAPLRVVIDVDEPSTRDVEINVESRTLRGSLLRVIADVDEEIKRFIVRYIAQELNKPAVAAAREIDVAARLDSAWRLDPPA
ncbi:MAG: hypothetical protein HOQ24_18825 [Mycobacteriaceae bacterium]|nr:hypothetical protein [Mycobacteriaceae bacterium]